MFSGFMLNAWAVATIVAVVAGLVGFFVVLRGAAFVAHAIPNGSFAGAAGASLIGASTIVGLGVFGVAGALGIGLLGRRARNDVATALALVVMLGLGALFVSVSAAYAPEIYSLLFGEVLGVSSQQIGLTLGLGIVCVGAIGAIYRPLLLSSVLAEVGEARGVSRLRVELSFLVVVALATTMTVPVVGTLLIFSLMIGAPGAARSFASSPGRAIVASVGISVVTIWTSLAASYATDYPVGFFVGSLSATAYGIGRGWSAHRGRRDGRNEISAGIPAFGGARRS